ncbi:MAG: DUF1080 domain-containing protein [Verrucomicrobiota bacterium]|jgi:hypothetical protein
MKHKILSITLALASLTISRSTLAQKEITIGGVAGYQDTPMQPGGKWHVHDPERPQPAIVAPGTFSTPEQPGKPPADAIVLFDGKDLSQWRDKAGRPAPWRLTNGVMISARSDIVSTREFGDMQLHVEFSEPTPARGRGQERGNSGVFLMDEFEVQVLDCYDNPTYADGAMAALYGQHPPLVNACLPPGQWQVYDIIFTAPRFETNTAAKPAQEAGSRAMSPSIPQFECTDPNVVVKTPGYVTVIHNGVVVQNHQSLRGPTGHRILAKYTPHRPTGPVGLQFHNNPVSFRNIWVRPIETPDDP